MKTGATGPMVWALIPHSLDGERLTAATYDNERTKSELAASFHALGLPWVWQPVVLASIADLVQQLTASMARRPTIAFNFCDGLDRDGVPGLSLVKELARAGVPFTGSDPRFYENSTYKLRMKQLFLAHGVETAPWEVLPRNGPASGVCARLGVPLMVKPDVSYASYGLTLRSKVCSDAELEARRAELRAREMVTLLFESDAFAERYLAGEEYTVFVGGFRDDPERIWTLPPAQRCFAPSIPEAERFLTYDRYWGYYDEESAPEDGQAFYRYELVDGDLRDELVDLATRAFRAVDGYGYARVDVRRDTINGRLSVLEVNANCGLSGDNETSTGAILQRMGWHFPGLLQRIIRQTLERAPS